MTCTTAISIAQQEALHVYGVRQIDEPTVEPVSLEEARRHLRITAEGSPPTSYEDDWLLPQISAAREYCERYLGRALAARTLELATNAFPSGAIGLPLGPVQSITSITYLDQAAAQATYDAAYTAAYDAEFTSSGDAALADAAGIAAGDIAFDAALPGTVDSTDYEINPFVVPNTVVLAYGSTWPTSRDAANAVRIRYVTGYNADDDSPKPYPLPRMARAAILLMLAHLYENREATAATALAEIPLGVQSLLDMLPRERLGMA